MTYWLPDPGHSKIGRPIADTGEGEQGAQGGQ